MVADSINIQREKIQKGNPSIHIVGACRLNNGIVQLNAEQLRSAVDRFESNKSDHSMTFFIPASGSGSRMFGFLFDYLNNTHPSKSTIKALESLIQHIDEFPFYGLIPNSYKEGIKNGEIDISAFLELLLKKEPFCFSTKPKGLIPFHQYGSSIRNPFQEHIVQSLKISNTNVKFHFTINDTYRSAIEKCLDEFLSENNLNASFEFSVQDVHSDSVAFGSNLTPIKSGEGESLKRPSGHGALLSNLNAIDTDLIFIRNIDNVQHENKAIQSINYRRSLAGELMELQSAIREILLAIDSNESVLDKVNALNERFDLRISDETINNSDSLRTFLNRPARVCGMVKNEGQPGGGPFWVEDENGNLNRQIIEKVQISHEQSQIQHVLKSTHFNPVEIVCGVKDYQGKKFDLLDFRNDEQYFIVNKTHEGQDIQYVEQPGLWNGGMENWITLFYEIDSSCFSPVKTVLDLLDDAHQA